MLLTDEKIAELEEKEVSNVLAKLEGGGTLTDREWAIVKRRRAEKDSAPTSAAQEGRRGLAARFGVNVKMIDRCNAVGAKDGVPPPWSDVVALADWYRAHYRADLDKPPTQRKELPEWLQRALDKREELPALPAEAVPLPPVAPPEAVTAAGALETARQIVEAARQRWMANPRDVQAEREYLDKFEQLQQIEARSRKAGDDAERVSRAEVEELVAKFNARVPRRFLAELIAALPEIRRAVETAQSWKAFAEHFVERTCRRLIETRFQDDAEE